MLLLCLYFRDISVPLFCGPHLLSGNDFNVFIRSTQAPVCRRSPVLRAPGPRDGALQTGRDDSIWPGLPCLQRDLGLLPRGASHAPRPALQQQQPHGGQPVLLGPLALHFVSRFLHVLSSRQNQISEKDLKLATELRLPRWASKSEAPAPPCVCTPQAEAGELSFPTRCTRVVGGQTSGCPCSSSLLVSAPVAPIPAMCLCLSLQGAQGRCCFRPAPSPWPLLCLAAAPHSSGSFLSGSGLLKGPFHSQMSCPLPVC